VVRTFPGIDATCQDGGATQQVSSYGLRGVFLWVDLGSLVFEEGVDVAPEVLLDAPGVRVL
jgi:hypothetical protein